MRRTKRDGMEIIHPPVVAMDVMYLRYRPDAVLRQADNTAKVGQKLEPALSLHLNAQVFNGIPAELRGVFGIDLLGNKGILMSEYLGDLLHRHRFLGKLGCDSVAQDVGRDLEFLPDRSPMTVDELDLENPAGILSKTAQELA